MVVGFQIMILSSGINPELRNWGTRSLIAQCTWFKEDAYIIIVIIGDG